MEATNKEHGALLDAIVYLGVLIESGHPMSNRASKAFDVLSVSAPTSMELQKIASDLNQRAVFGSATALASCVAGLNMLSDKLIELCDSGNPPESNIDEALSDVIFNNAYRPYRGRGVCTIPEMRSLVTRVERALSLKELSLITIGAKRIISTTNEMEKGDADRHGIEMAVRHLLNAVRNVDDGIDQIRPKVRFVLAETLERLANDVLLIVDPGREQDVSTLGKSIKDALHQILPGSKELVNMVDLTDLTAFVIRLRAE